MTYNILGTKYRVKKTPLISQGIMGICNVEKKQILIDPTLKGDELVTTTLHEFLHATFHEGSIGQAVSREVEEIVVDLFAKSLAKNFDFNFEEA